jgi:hypothetical protein
MGAKCAERYCEGAGKGAKDQEGLQAAFLGAAFFLVARPGRVFP